MKPVTAAKLRSELKKAGVGVLKYHSTTIRGYRSADYPGGAKVTESLTSSQGTVLEVFIDSDLDAKRLTKYLERVREVAERLGLSSIESSGSIWTNTTKWKRIDA